MSSPPLLEIRNLKTYFSVSDGIFFQKIKNQIRAVDNISLEIRSGEILGLVGESGCGKSTLGRTILQLIQPTAGEVLFDGKSLTSLSVTELRQMRSQFQMIFQDPYASLNPRMTVFDTLAEALLFHRQATRKTVEQKVSELMELVGLAPRFIRKYPHEFSGGQRQRIAIARALAPRPKLLIADEPVSALDVSIQSQIINLLSALVKKFQLSMIFISHDLSVVRHLSDRVAVMYLGEIVETGDTQTIFSHPMHPYTQALLSAIPLPDPRRERERKRILLEGDPPSPMNPPLGCRFHPRCPMAQKECATQHPQLRLIQQRRVGCLLAT